MRGAYTMEPGVSMSEAGNGSVSYVSKLCERYHNDK